MRVERTFNSDGTLLYRLHLYLLIVRDGVEFSSYVFLDKSDQVANAQLARECGYDTICRNTYTILSALYDSESKLYKICESHYNKYHSIETSIIKISDLL